MPGSSSTVKPIPADIHHVFPSLSPDRHKMPDPDIALYFLNSSRAIRVAWLLEELNLSYEVICADRAPNGLAPPEFKSQIPHPLGKSPTIKDGAVVVSESGAILEYLCETYDKESKFLPADPAIRANVRQWLHAAEGTFMTHGLAILYARWQMPEEGKGMLKGMEERLSKNVRNDLGWLEGTLKDQKGKGRDWIVGDSITIADIQMQFRYVLCSYPSIRFWLSCSIEFMFERKLGVDPARNEFPEIISWMARTKEEAAYKKAVKKTGYTLEGNFKK
jgi:glutathione S-transferase